MKRENEQARLGHPLHPVAGVRDDLQVDNRRLQVRVAKPDVHLIDHL